MGFGANLELQKNGTLAESYTPFNIYPNPASDKVTINFDDNSTDYLITIYSIDGKIASNSIVASDQHELYVSEYPNGVYFIEISSEKKTYTEKLVITNE
ncbi:MAG: T9SS type A sorting domain-containing protein [Flavobacteriales bacterium]|nr:T9SS type A sorting domain-containing protein [Flavobacteriales bacterium]